MKNRYTINGLALIFALLMVNQGWSQITAQQAVKAMGRGINLGNTFDAPNFEGYWGTEAREYYFDMYKDAGFSTVRIPVTWDVRLGTEAPYALDEDFMKRIDTVIGWGLDRGLYVIINVHHDAWIKNKETFDEQKPRFYALWEQLSERYKDYPENLFFEIVNEPHYEEGTVSKSLTQTQLDELNKESLTIIRLKNPTRITIYGGKQWSSSDELLNAAIPDANDSYLMGYYHSYDPWNFAGEGIGTWGTQNDVNAMEAQMVKVENWSIEKNIPVLIGEFGAKNTCDYNSRMLYYAKYTELALKHNLAFTVWDDDGWFQILQRKDSSWNGINDILINSSDTSPTSLKVKMIEDTVVQLTWLSRLQTKEQVFIERRTLSTEFSVIAEFGAVSSTTTVTEYNDTDVQNGKTYYYRVVEGVNATLIPSYPISIPVVFTSISENKVEELSVYPNPALRQINIALADEQIETVVLYSADGKLLMTKNIDASNASINIENLKGGIYFIIAKTSKGLHKTKFVKQ